jgi:general secretion pathway protein C
VRGGLQPALDATLSRAISPAGERGWRLGAYVLAALWLAVSALTAVRSFGPAAIPLPAPSGTAGVPTQSTPRVEARSIDINEVAGWSLFGTSGSPELQLEAETAAPQFADRDLQGIEDEAEDTDLPVLLVGVIAARDSAAGRAMIEAANTQAQYAVGDELPLSGNVTVARILPDRVVLDNGGNYELLRLFDDSGRIASIGSREIAAEELAATARRERLDERNRNIRQMAAAQRRGSGPAPTRLSQVLNIAAASEDEQLLGYRVTAAGRNRGQFEALGFREGDIVTSVNGASIAEPGKASELFKAVRSGQAASLGIMRDGQELTLEVGVQRSLAR